MTDQNTVNIKAYSADGYPVYLTLEISHAEDIGAQVTAYLASLKAANLMPREQGVEQGENAETVTAMVRRSKANDDGSTTPIIDLYTGENNFKTLSLYLNTDDDVHAFEAATGVKLASLPEYDSNAAIERKDTGRWNKYARTPVHPTRFVHMQNPAYTGAEGDMKPKRKFVRWMPDAAASSPPPVSGSRSDAILSEIENSRSQQSQDAVKPKRTHQFTVSQIIVGKTDNGAHFLEFKTALDDGELVNARYWGKSGQRLTGLQDAIGHAEYQALRDPGLVNLEFPILVSAETDSKGYWNAVRVDTAPAPDIVF